MLGILPHENGDLEGRHKRMKREVSNIRVVAPLTKLVHVFLANSIALQDTRLFKSCSMAGLDHELTSTKRQPPL